MLLTGILSLSAVLIMTFISYRASVNSAMAEARKPGRLILNFFSSSHHFLEKSNRIDLISSCMLSRGVWEELQKDLPEYTFKQAAVNPIYPTDKADKNELLLLETLSRKNDEKSAEGVLKKNGESFFYLAAPVRATQECMQCHGDPERAPQEQIDRYGRENGYNWQVGDTVAANIVYVPLNQSLQTARKDARNLFLFSSGGILLVMLIVGYFFNFYVVEPVTMLKQRAAEISLGNNIDDSIATKRSDEIGSLARAIDRLRISVQKLMEMHRR
jgi:HAMP domain-containing protein